MREGEGARGRPQRGRRRGGSERRRGVREKALLRAAGGAHAPGTAPRLVLSIVGPRPPESVPPSVICEVGRQAGRKGKDARASEGPQADDREKAGRGEWRSPRRQQEAQAQANYLHQCADVEHATLCEGFSGRGRLLVGKEEEEKLGRLERGRKRCGAGKTPAALPQPTAVAAGGN